MKPWHDKALALRKDGAHPKEIAHQLGMSLDAVRWVLNENGEREKTRKRAALSRAGATKIVRARNVGLHAVREHRVIAEPGRDNGVRKSAICGLAAKFVAGSIDRQEFNRLLASQYPPRSASSGAGERG